MATRIGDVNIPRSPFLDTTTNRPAREWLMYLLKIGNAWVYGSFSDTTTQTATANTATIVTFNTTDMSNGISLSSGSKLTCYTAGIYNIQFSVQFYNTDTSVDDVFLWLRKNGVDVPNSGGSITVPSSHGGNPGSLIQGWNFFISLNAGDYIQLVWSTASGNTSIKYYAPASGPTRPGSPSIITTINQVTP